MGGRRRGQFTHRGPSDPASIGGDAGAGVAVPPAGVRPAEFDVVVELEPDPEPVKDDVPGPV